MAVAVVTEVRYREFAGYSADPALPLGTWITTGSIIGDVSGGDKVITFVFNAGAPLDQRYFSLEFFSGFSTGVAALVGVLATGNLDFVQTGGGRLALPKEFQTGFLAGSGGAGAVVNPANAEPMRGLFLGRQVTTAAASSLLWTTPNVDAVVQTIVIGGYHWGVRSVNAPGGPSRPAQGFYRN